MEGMDHNLESTVDPIHSPLVQRKVTESDCPSMSTIEGVEAILCLFDELPDSEASGYVGQTRALNRLWIRLEIVEIAFAKLKSFARDPRVKKRVSELLSKTELEQACTHENSDIRLAAFSVLHLMTPLYEDENTGTSKLLELECELWQRNLPSAIKICTSDRGNKEYAVRLLRCLMGFVNRLAAGSSSQKFVCDFLVQDLVLRQCLYPGTVSAKESFALPLLRHLLRACENSSKMGLIQQRLVVCGILETLAFHVG